jgi:hypothetical protein
VHNPVLNLAPFSRWTLRDKAAQRWLSLRWPDIVHFYFEETPMERLDKSQSHSFQPVRVQTKVIKEMLTYLEGREGLEIIADDVRYESANELVQDRGNTRVKELTIKARSPYISLVLNPCSARLFTDSSSAEATGLFVTIRGHLRRYEAKPRIFYSLFWMLALLIISSLILYFPVLSSYQFLRIYIFMFFLAWYFLWGYVNITRYSDVYIDDGVSKPGFFSRNKDTIVVGTVTAIIGAIVGSVLTKALEPPKPIDKSPSPTTKSIDRGR